MPGWKEIGSKGEPDGVFLSDKNVLSRPVMDDSKTGFVKTHPIVLLCKLYLNKVDI